MTARVIKVKYIQGNSDSYIVTGCKRGTYPRGGLCFGGNGTYRQIFYTPSDIKVFMRSEDGQRLWSCIGRDVRRICGWNKLNAGRAQRVIDASPYEVELVWDGRWKISEWALRQWLENL